MFLRQLQICLLVQIGPYIVAVKDTYTYNINPKPGPGGGGAIGYFLGGDVPPGTPNWPPVLKNISPKNDIPF